MRQNFKMVITYDGSRYYGWEHQPDREMTIQGKLEHVASLMTGEDVEVIGAGRTDAGVHARGLVAHMRLHTRMQAEEKCRYKNH